MQQAAGELPASSWVRRRAPERSSLNRPSPPTETWMVACTFDENRHSSTCFRWCLWAWSYQPVYGLPLLRRHLQYVVTGMICSLRKDHFKSETWSELEECFHLKKENLSRGWAAGVTYLHCSGRLIVLFLCRRKDWWTQLYSSDGCGLLQYL